MNVKRGQVYWIDRGSTTGCEMWGNRPGIVVSNDRNNANSKTVEIIYMTAKPKRDLPTHVTIRSVGRGSTALCEQVTTVDVSRLGNYMGDISEAEMQSLEVAMLISLGLQLDQPETEGPEDIRTPLRDLNTRLLRRELEAETVKRKALQWAYESLVAQILKKEEA